MSIFPNRDVLRLNFQPALGGLLGEMTSGDLFWDRGGTVTLEKFRTVPDLHLLVYCLEGRSDYLDETGVSTVIYPGDLMLIPRGLAHTYRPAPEHGWSEIFIWMRGPLPDFWWSSGFLQPGLTLLNAEPVVQWALWLCHLCESKTSDERLSQLQNWFSTLQGDSQRFNEAKVPWFQTACSALESGTMREPNLLKLSQSLGVSYESFRKIFTLQARVSPGKYRAVTVIQKSCRLLGQSNRLNKEIAEELDFADEFHFARTFRRHIGMSPSQYRALKKTS